MEVDVYQILTDNRLVLVFTVLGLGILLGRIKLAGMPLGSTIGVLLVGLYFGHVGLTIDESVGTFGFALFIFSVGLQAGPSFFSAIREDGARYLVLAVVVATTGALLTLLTVRLFDLPAGLDAGLMAGALTSTPMLAGAQDAFLSGIGNTGALSADAAYSNVSVGYAITYLGGVAGVVLFVSQVPRLLNIDLREAAVELERQRGLSGKRRLSGAQQLPIIRAYEVQERSDGKTLAQARQDLGLTAIPLKVKRGGDFVEAEPELVLQKGDVISVFAELKVHRQMQQEIGAEVLDPVLLDYDVVSSDIVVLSESAVGKPLRDQDLLGRHGCFATGVSRAGIELPFNDAIVLHRGDRIHVTGERSRMESAAAAVGYIEEEVEETDLVTFSFGIAGGVLIGLLLFKVGEISFGLGMAGGLLLTGLLIGFASSLNPTFGRVPQPARYLLLELGLLLFMARVGVSAGGSVVETLSEVGPVLILSGLVITLTPAALAYLVGKHFMKMNPALLLGSVTGAMTSTPALSVLNQAARSPVPSLGYAGTYTIANVLLTFTGAAIAML